MDLPSRKLAFVQEFLRIQKEELVEKLEKVMREEITDSDDGDLKPMSKEELEDRIDRSLEDSKNGRTTKAEVLKAKLDKWT